MCGGEMLDRARGRTHHRTVSPCKDIPLDIRLAPLGDALCGRSAVRTSLHPPDQISTGLPLAGMSNVARASDSRMVGVKGNLVLAGHRWVEGPSSGERRTDPGFRSLDQRAGFENYI